MKKSIYIKTFGLIIISVLSLQSCGSFNNNPEREVGRQPNQNTTSRNESNRGSNSSNSRNNNTSNRNKSNRTTEQNSETRTSNERKITKE